MQIKTSTCPDNCHYFKIRSSKSKTNYLVKLNNLVDLEEFICTLSMNINRKKILNALICSKVRFYFQINFSAIYFIYIVYKFINIEESRRTSGLFDEQKMKKKCAEKSFFADCK